ncbi:hypothetical protein ACLOJK_002559 [Asimina triloba]
MMRGRVRFPAAFPLENAPFLAQSRHLCTSTSGGKSTSNGSDTKSAAIAAHQETYKQLQNLDFMTAAKMLFTAPPQKKKFGLDFHLAYFLVTAVYLVAQYARYEIRRMEAEAEQKKKEAEEEEKAKELDLKVADEERSGSELSKVKVRLDALEETVKEIADETKKLSAVTASKDQVSSIKEEPTSVNTSTPRKSESSVSTKDEQDKKSKTGESSSDSS